jgi:hypothetical protein
VTKFAYLSLASVIVLAAADKPGGGSSQADDARAKAQAARDAQAEAEKAKADKEAQAAKDRSDGGGAQSDGDQREGDAPPVDAGGLDPTALLARLDAQDRLIKTLTAQMAGAQGPAVGEPKDTQAASPGAALDPRITRTMPPGVSSSPALQPMPAGDGGRGGSVAALGGSALWGENRAGGPVQARAYPNLQEEDVVVTATGYHDDTIRNAGDIMRGYTGPAASWFVPASWIEKFGNIEDAARRWKREIADFARDALA